MSSAAASVAGCNLTRKPLWVDGASVRWVLGMESRPFVMTLLSLWQGRMSEALLQAVRGLHVADPDLGVKPLLAKLREQQPDLAAGNKEVREALIAVKAAESEAKAAAAASPDKASALSHAALRAKSSQSAPWIQPGLKPLPPTALHQWVHEHDEEASVSEVPPSDTSVWAQFPESSSSPAEDACEGGDWPEQTPPRCISPE